MLRKLTSFAGLTFGTLGVTAHPLLGRYATRIDSRALSNESSYDFVIAGGGIAGLTVADRLTEDPNVTVLVIEYGPFDQREDSVMVPGAYNPFPYLWFPLESTPQTALNGTEYLVPCGRVVGGGSVVNAMFWHRSSKIDYQAWEDLGATGWDWEGLIEYFKKSENFTAPDAEYAASHNLTWDPSVHGEGGPVQSSYSPYDYPGDANFWNAARSLEIAAAFDPSAGDATGIEHLEHSVDPKTQTRSTARIAHYDRVIASRPNYHILPSTAVSKILFNGTTAVGVEYANTTTQETATVKAAKEVIVAAGSAHSPQILQLSGVGDASYLADFGIESVVDLPGVGRNLQDHLVLTVTYNYTNNLFPNAGSLTDNATYAAEQRALYDAFEPSAYDLTATTGNLIIQLPLKNWTSGNDSSIIALAKSQDPASLLAGNPDSTVIAGYTKQRDLIISHMEAGEGSVGDISWSTGPSTTIYMTRPLSRGSVLINSSSIFIDPLIDFGAVTDPTDLDVLLAIYKRNRDIMATPEIAVLGPIETSPAPGANATDDEIKEALKGPALVPTNAHMCCTNAMMAEEDGGVVDSENRVYGTSGLSVVDASVWPLVVASGPQASVYASGEKAADLIKARWGLS